MLSTERTDFETHLAVLFGGYPTFLTPPRIEAYWRGLAKMPLSVFVRCVDYALGEKGQDKLPTVNTLWQISKTLRTNPRPQAQADTPAFDGTHAWGNRCLLAFMVKHNGVPDMHVQPLVDIKNRIVEQRRMDGDALDTDATDWRDVLWQALDTALRSATEQRA